MKNSKGFTLIELLVIVSIIGLLALIGLRVYGDQQEKVKNAIVKANVGTVQTIIQGELADKIITLGDAVDTATMAGLHNPFNNASMENDDDFPDEDINLAPGKIKITLSDDGVFSIQGCGTNGLFPDIFTARK